ncbi:helix-turn-helix domain-containing protein [Streptomyces sp. NPDC017991]|uniref:helix-turn-helix domain-containing protein n=1 Tax=Streptomyces sp. NPDC017991 TaxID=3365026 RepID=UPI003787DB5B
MKALYDRFASSEDGGRLLAAARLRREVLRVLYRTLSACGVSQTELASRLRIRKSAVNQVFNGDGNLRVNTLANYLSVLGYEVELRVVPAGEPRKAIVEGREMIPAFDREWTKVEAFPDTSCDEGEQADLSGAFGGAGGIQVQLSKSELSSTLVEMRCTDARGFSESLYDFTGNAEVTVPVISPTREFRSIRNEASRS